MQELRGNSERLNVPLGNPRWDIGIERQGVFYADHLYMESLILQR